MCQASSLLASYRLRAILLCLTICIQAYSAWSDQPERHHLYPLPHSIRNLCAPGQRIPFVIGSLTLYVDVQWLSILPVVNEPLSFAKCPTRPITVEHLYLRMPAASGIAETIKVDRLTLSAATRAPRNSGTGGGTSSTVPWVDDVTQTHQFHAEYPDLRVFQLHFPNDAVDSDDPIQILCARGHDIESCENRHHIFRNLDVFFSLSLPTMITPPSESDVLLQFAKRLRDWVTSLTHQP